jgi:bifunctional DNA-binding transcriptional regulator/antitoxin component of YhaV-PrlF toxin-antitoxin module
MIVRVFTEGQYRIPDEQRERLNELDNDVVAVCRDGDEQRFRESYDRLLEFVRSAGERLPDDELTGSDLMLPPPDITFEEAKTEFSGEGLIPD